MVRNKIHYLLIKHLDCSKKEALTWIETGEVTINNTPIFCNQFFAKHDLIKFRTIILHEPIKTFTYVFYKPKGIECTLNDKIENNLKAILPFNTAVFPIGRLDKASEGLLLLTNDGQLYRELNHYDSNVEKEYLVTVNQSITLNFIEKMAQGVEIMGKNTLPCIVERLDEHNFKIILKEGRNRQIRRMCYKLGYEVTTLFRIRLGEYHIKSLQPNEYYLIE
jgi:23S rRNA pseudouridine2604 synthase